MVTLRYHAGQLLLLIACWIEWCALRIGDERVAADYIREHTQEYIGK